MMMIENGKQPLTGKLALLRLLEKRLHKHAIPVIFQAKPLPVD
jgi:hypothetical protein